MTLAWRRVAVLCAGIAMTGTVSSCKALQRAGSDVSRSPAALSGAFPAPQATGSPASCPFSAADVGEALGGQWQAASLPSGGCHYTHDGRTILVSAVPVPKDPAQRAAALAQVRKPCDAGSTHLLRAAASGSFVCRRETLVEAATISGDHLVVVCTPAGSDPSAVPVLQKALSALVSRAV